MTPLGYDDDAFAEAVTKDGHVIQRHSRYRHRVSGNTFTVLVPDSSRLPDEYIDAVDDPSEPFVYCYTQDYDTRATAHLARRLFDSQLTQLQLTPDGDWEPRGSDHGDAQEGADAQ